jgi:hypothetical protein
MTSKVQKYSNSEIYAGLAAIQLSAEQRAEAVAGLQVGEKIADAVLATAHVLRLLVAVPALKPSFKPLQPSFRH